MQISLRRRIFFWYALIVPLIIVGLAFVAQKIMVEGLRNEVDTRLEERTEVVASTIILNTDVIGKAYEPLLDWLTKYELPYVPAVLRVSDPERNVFASFGDIPEPMLSVMDHQLLLPEIDEGRFETIRIKGQETLRLYTVPVRDPITSKTIALVQTGDSLASVVEAQRELWRYALAVGIGGSVVALLMGSLIFRQGLRPLDRILYRVSEIGGKDLTVRIPEERRPQELQQLADILNSMIERLDMAFRTREIFIASVSHDLKTPLTVLQGQIDVLLMEPSLDVEAKQRLETMARELRRLIRMTNNLLLSAQLESGPVFAPIEVELSELLGEVKRDAQVLSQGLSLTVSVPEIVVVPGDYDLLKQMVLNVVDNAIKFTPKRGTVAITLSCDEMCATIKVSDTGRGMSKEQLANVDKPFHKVDTSRKPSRGGTGLGLAIVKQIIDLHNGQTEIHSQEGVGTTVTMRLPLGPYQHNIL